MAVKPIPGEVPWRAEVIGTAKWRGVPLRKVLQAVGIEADARYVAFTSLDETQFEGEQVHFGSSIALEKAFSPDVLLAYEMAESSEHQRRTFPSFCQFSHHFSDFGKSCRRSAGYLPVSHRVILAQGTIKVSGHCVSSAGALLG